MAAITSGHEVTDALTRWLESQLPEALEILRQMVGINSFTANRDGVNRLGQYTAEVFAPLGFAAEIIPSDHLGHGDHLVLRHQTGHRPTIGLVTHLDTVFPPEEEEKNNFGWRVEGDRIYGPGTHDIKGGTVMIYLVLSALQKFYPAEFALANWVILADAHEEQLAEDFGALCSQTIGKRALACLVFEGGLKQGLEFSLVVARKGRLEFKVSAVGRSAHAGGAHSVGVNAITQLSHLLPKVADLTDYAQDLTVNVGSIRGGTVINRVPQEAEALGEMRAFDPATLQLAQQRLLDLGDLDRAGIRREASTTDGFSAQVKIEVIQQSPGWPRNPATDQLYQFWSQAAADLGWKTLAEHRGGLSDGNYTVQHLPTLDGLGPCGGNDHCSERSPDGCKLPEFVEISSFVPKAVLNILAIRQLLRSSS